MESKHIYMAFGVSSPIAQQKESHLHSLLQGRGRRRHLSKIRTPPTDSYCHGWISYLGLYFLKVAVKPFWSDPAKALGVS